MKSIYTYYKDRLIEISGRNRCICLKTLNKKSAYDLGRLFEQDQDNGKNFLSFLFTEKKDEFVILDKATIQKAKPENNSLEKDAAVLRSIARDIDEIEKETGRYELYVGFPFVTGTVKDLVMKGPLLLFPVGIEISDESVVTLIKKQGVQLNKALIYAYANTKRLKLEDLETEFAWGKEHVKDINSILAYLKQFGFDFTYDGGGFLSYDKLEPQGAPKVQALCTLGRYSFANSVYADYVELQRRRLTNEAIDQLLNTKQIKPPKKKAKAAKPQVYASHYSDYAQSKVISQISEKGNMVVYGPPGTGKSQTIVNIISDAVIKNKRVLVVSQKKAALDVVFNRLGEFGCKAMYITDAEKDKKMFYDKCLERHRSIVKCDEGLKNIEGLDEAIAQRKAQLEEMSALLYTKTEFGPSPSEMYAQSYMIGKSGFEYSIYGKMLESKLMELNYEELKEAVMSLKSGKAQIYYDFSEEKKKNPYIDFLKPDLDIYTISKTKTALNELIGQRTVLFNRTKYPYARQILAYAGELHSDDYSPLVKMIAKLKHPGAYKARSASYALFPILPITLSHTAKIEEDLEKSFAATKAAIDEYLEKYEFLRNVLTDEGYFTVADHLINGNSSVLKMILAGVEDYVGNRDISAAFASLSPAQKTILEFAYANSNSASQFHTIIDRILIIRIYRELLDFEEKHKDVLHKLVEFDSVRKDILRLNAMKAEEVRRIALKKFDNEYLDCLTSPSAKDYLYQISKKQNYWPIRKTTEVYGEYLFRLFPCWLLSPENVSTILPLKKNLFDIILFDEASQIFIENTLPAVFRGSRIVVAGDSKQLRPTAVFMKRYMGGEPDESDYSAQAALEVESLLDLAVARYDSCNLTYHYRSRYEELIDFSSRAFYSNELQISPNTVKSRRIRPIERIKVDGKWIDRRNEVEAEKVVELLKKIFKQRKENETIGIITFNAEQEHAIEDIIDRESYHDERFRSNMIKESARKENGEDVSIFVKNIENVQGDERDIIIFSIGYAYNETGKMVTNFGSLGVEGGENRLNVLITRAKKKIYVVTSIEPEDLKTESKNVGPKLFRKYLEYARAVSDGNDKETKLILSSLHEIEEKQTPMLLQPIEVRIKEELEKFGYKAEIGLGNSKVRISLAVYDPASGRYLVGVQTEADALRSSDSAEERDVFIPEFLESRGWRLLRIWNRDWWLNPRSVVETIIDEAEKSRALIEAAVTKNRKLNFRKSSADESDETEEDEDTAEKTDGNKPNRTKKSPPKDTAEDDNKPNRTKKSPAQDTVEKTDGNKPNRAKKSPAQDTAEKTNGNKPTPKKRN